MLRWGRSFEELFLGTFQDVHTLDLSSFYPINANISFVSLIDLSTRENKRLSLEFRKFQLSDGIRENLELTVCQRFTSNGHTVHELRPPSV